MEKSFGIVLLVTILAILGTVSAYSQTTEEKIQAVKSQLIELNKQRIRELEEENRRYSQDVRRPEAPIGNPASYQTVAGHTPASVSPAPALKSLDTPITLPEEEAGPEVAAPKGPSPPQQDGQKLKHQKGRIRITQPEPKGDSQEVKVTGDSYPIVITFAGDVDKITLVVTTDGKKADPKEISVTDRRRQHETIDLKGKIVTVEAFNTDNPQETSGEIQLLTDKEVNPKQSTEKPKTDVAAYFGTEIAGASSAESTATPYFDIQARAQVRKLGFSRLTDNAGWLSFFVDFKLSSTASQTLPNFGSLQSSAISNFFGTNQSTSLNTIVKAFKVKGGVEYGLGHNFSIIAGGGITSPISSQQSVHAYKIPRRTGCNVPQPDDCLIEGFTDIVGDASTVGKENVLFTSAERDRFFRNYFVGGRLLIQHDEKNDANPYEFEITAGQDEAISKRLSGVVLKFDSNVSIPIPGPNFLYFGAGFALRLGRAQEIAPPKFFLEPSTNFSTFNNTQNMIVDIDKTPYGTSRRDTYSFRIGIDLVKLLKGSAKPQP